MGFNAFILQNKYTRVKGLGDHLALMKDIIDWDKFRPIVASVYYDNDAIGGRPHTDEVLLVRCMILQAWYQEKKAKKNGETIIYSKKQESHIDKDASFSSKHGQVHYGYKNHIKIDTEYNFIRDYTVTTASMHDSRVDLSKVEEVMYRDKGYTGCKTKAKENASMKSI
jgi:IS5 family transposase